MRCGSRLCCRAVCLLGCLCAVSVLVSGCAARVAGRTPPNIVLIMADDVGVEAFDCYGESEYDTSAIDALAASGVRFTNCHAQPLCTPSRVKLMTGLSNARNYAAFSILDPSQPTFAQMLRDAGYATAVTGKWQLFGAEHYGDAAGTGQTPEQAGFDEHLLWQVRQLGSRYWDPLLERDGELMPVAAGQYGPDQFTEFAIKFASRHADEPFFLYYPMALVHDPFVPTPQSADRESKDKHANFADMVAYMDACVGRIVQGLEAAGLRENTLVIFTADNGTHRSITTETARGPIQGGKGLTNDRGTHVPLIVSWPGHDAPGSVCGDLVDLSDILATIAEAAGTAPGWAIDGVSFLPQVRGRAGSPREWLYCSYDPRPGNPRFPPSRWARDTRWKLYGDGRLYDLAADPDERSPIGAGEDTESSAAARGKLAAVIDGFPARSPLLRE